MRARYSHRVAPLLSRPALGAVMAASFFSESFLQQVGLHAQVGIHPLQSSVLFLQSLHLAHHRGIHTAILRTPFNGMDCSPPRSQTGRANKRRLSWQRSRFWELISPRMCSSFMASIAMVRLS